MYQLRYFNNMQLKYDVTSVVLFAATLHHLCTASNGDNYGFSTNVFGAADKRIHHWRRMHLPCLLLEMKVFSTGKEAFSTGNERFQC